MRIVLITTLFAILCSHHAYAESGVDINWGTGCWWDGTPFSNRTFACNSNSGSQAITVSFASSLDQPEFRGLEVLILGLTEAPTVPAWWQMAAGECRDGALTASADFAGAPEVACVKGWSEAPATTLSYQHGTEAGGPNRFSIKVGCALTTPVPLVAGTEYYGCRITIDRSRTAGTGACAGCPSKLIMGLYSVTAIGTGWREVLTCPFPGGNQCLSWQSSTLPCNQPTTIVEKLDGTGDGCTEVVSTRNETWGRVKSLYR